MRAAPDDGRAASRALYHELAQKGWSKEEIYAVAGLTPDGEPWRQPARSRKCWPAQIRVSPIRGAHRDSE